MDTIEERVTELRSADPHGRRSDNDLYRQAKIEDLHRQINDLRDFPKIRAILSDIVALLETNF